MFGLLSKLGTIHYTELDVDEILDKREMDSFDSEWVRVYQAIEDQKRGKNIDDTKDIREKSIYDSLPAIRLRRVSRIYFR